MLKSTDTGALETPEPPAEAPPARRTLGAMLVFKHQAIWSDVTLNAQHNFDLDDPTVLKRWEKRLASRIYRVYGYHEAPDAEWEFFALLEFGDLDAWQQLQKYLDASGFSTYYAWDIVVLGRRMG